jgi:hypothetical protein
MGLRGFVSTFLNSRRTVRHSPGYRSTPSTATFCSSCITDGRNANGRSGSKNVFIMSMAKSYWRNPFSTSSSAIRFFSSRACWPTSVAPLISGNGSLLSKRFSLAIDHLSGYLVILDRGIAINEAPPLFFPLRLICLHGLSHLDQSR